MFYSSVLDPTSNEGERTKKKKKCFLFPDNRQQSNAGAGQKKTCLFLVMRGLKLIIDVFNQFYVLMRTLI